MPEYTKYKRGSQWRKWDLHFHSQTSYDYHDKSVDDAKLIAGLVANGIEAIAITDHHKIDETRIRNLQTLSKDEILILPGIEFRSELGGTELMHFIGIFPENSDINYIWKQLQVRCKIDDADIVRRGGYERTFCDFKETANLIHELGGLVSVHAGKKSNSLERLKNDIKDDLEVNRCIDILEVGNVNDIEAYHKIVFPNIKRVIPIVLCSDNHNINGYFTKQNLWIKSDLTFEGLKQIIYEPEERVKIQALKPDVKNERHIISELEFIDSGNLFGNQKILLNENLNAIIGGKSSGKTLLIYSMANSIDPEQVDKASKRLGFEGYEFDSDFDFRVKWKNGDTDLFSNSELTSKLHKITYIPQLYINYLVEKNNKEELNALIKNILLQDSVFKEFYVEQIKSISDTTSEIESLLNEYIKIRNKALEVQQKSKDTGNSGNIKKAFEKIETEISQGQKTSNLSEEEFKDYNTLLRNKSENDSTLKTINIKEVVLSKVVAEIKTSKANMFGKIGTTSQVFLKGQIDKILDELGDVPEEIKSIQLRLEADFESLIKNLESEIKKLDLTQAKYDINEKIKNNSTRIQPYLKKIEGQKELQKLSARLESEKEKYQNAITLEKQLKSLLEEYSNIRKQTADLLKKRFEEYQQIEYKVNETKKSIGSDIELKCSLIYKVEDFLLYDQVNKAAINNNHFFNSLINENVVKYELIPEFYEKPLRVSDDKLFFSKDEIIPLRVRTSLEDVLRGLIKDSFEIDYTVTYKGDNLLNMSPGKKGTVLLILFLQISSSEFPILIDQPEDNLDNRTIYDLLCKMIKLKKKDRQIIIVSHNANLVVATDTENIIVANQQGQDSNEELSQYRFEYINGSLEHSRTKDEKIKSVLFCQGIREHVCDILEGGGEAFKQRERKYSIK